MAGLRLVAVAEALRIVIDGEPVFQARARPSRFGGYYDPDSGDKKRWRWIIGAQVRKAPKFPSGAPLHVDAQFYLPIADSLSRAKKTALEGQWHTGRGDVDNLLKFSFDAMNGVAFEDDRFISSVYTEKRFSSKPRAEFLIYAHGGYMIQEHAKTMSGEITPADLEYMIKKANHLGLQHREIFHVFVQEDGDGRHVYFECDAPRERS